MVGNPRLKPLNETPESVSGHNDALQEVVPFAVEVGGGGGV